MKSPAKSPAQPSVQSPVPARKAASRGRTSIVSTIPEPLVRLRDAARNGTYFECLGLGRDATTTEVREAYVALARNLDGLRRTVAGDPEAAAVLEEAAKVAEDAFAVLSDPDLRLTYRRALPPAEGREPWRS